MLASMNSTEDWAVDWGRVSDDIHEKLSTNVAELRTFQQSVQRFERDIATASKQLLTFEEKLAYWNKGIEAARQEHNYTLQEKRLKLQQKEADAVQVKNEMRCKEIEVALYQKQLIAVQQRGDLLCSNAVEATLSIETAAHEPDSCCNVDCWQCWRENERIEFFNLT